MIRPTTIGIVSYLDQFLKKINFQATIAQTTNLLGHLKFEQSYPVVLLMSGLK